MVSHPVQEFVGPLGGDNNLPNQDAASDPHGNDEENEQHVRQPGLSKC